MRIRIGTRSSTLAVAQAKIIADAITASYPDAEIITIPIKTKGDKFASPFSSDPFGIKGMFTLEIENSLRLGEIDIAVHSLKDVPVNISPELPIVAYSKRADPRDALTVRDDSMSVIGTSSARRKAQLKFLFPESKILPVRGNVENRLRKLDSGEYSALVLSAAGLERLGLSDRITRLFTVDEMIPAAGQGIIACQGRAGKIYDYLEGVDDENSRRCAAAERTFSRTLGAGCNIPAGVYAEIDGDNMTLRGFFGRYGVISGKVTEAEAIGRKLAEDLMS